MSEPDRGRLPLWRVAAGLAVGLAVAAVAYWCAYSTMRNVPYHRELEWRAQSELEQLAEAVEKHRQEKKQLPADLADVDGVKKPFGRDDGSILDPWGHPYHYHADGDTFTLLCFGRDGQPGGVEEDTDLAPDQPLAPPSLWRFTFEFHTPGVQWTCGLAGLCAALVCLCASRHPARRFLLEAAITAFASVCMAVVISMLHTPSGH